LGTRLRSPRNRQCAPPGALCTPPNLRDYGLEGSTGRIDFLMEWRTAPGTEIILTNAPNKIASEFAEHALRLCPRVMLLRPVQWLGAEKRMRIFDKSR
jgi:hypothetical protein